ncbi:hypothetical protein AK85_10695 [Streptococcus pneumoniae B1598]|nr:hypothetical protein AK85_10695 [Streptococcus pneumoniae B1598]
MGLNQTQIKKRMRRNKAFDGIAHLTTEERNKANKQVDAALEKAKQAIDAEITNAILRLLKQRLSKI